MSTEWEVFEKYHKRVTNAGVTIQRGGNIHLNTTAYEVLGKPTHVALSYSQSQHAIGIQGRKSEQGPNTRVRTTGSNHIVAGQAFARHYGIDTGTSRTYDVREQNGSLIVDLN